VLLGAVIVANCDFDVGSHQKTLGRIGRGFPYFLVHRQILIAFPLVDLRPV